jgi:hypothetical protein
MGRRTRDRALTTIEPPTPMPERRCTLVPAMTAKEKLLQRVPHWTEQQAERALRAAEGGGEIDEWGEVSNLREASTAETMRRLAQEEQAAGHEPW